MLGLLPRDQWQHHIGDIFRASAAIFASRSQHELLFLPELGNCIPVRSGRAALITAIKALNLPSGAKIGVPLYCCPVVFRAIVLAGCVARFIDVDDVTFCMSAKDLSAKHSEVDAVIAVHMFGNMCDMPRLQAAAPETPFIEDCAQSLGSKLAGRMAGSFGAISIFSFRSGKYLSVGEGGALFSNSADARSRAAAFVAALPAPTFVEELLHIVNTYVKSLLRSKPLYGIIGYRLWEGLNKRLNLSASSDVVLSKIYRADLALTESRLPLLTSAVEAHRANADSYSQNLTLAPRMLCPEPSECFYNRLQYPIIFPSRICRDAIAAYLLEQGIDTIKYLDDVVEIAGEAYGYTGTCPVSEQLSKRVLIIPNYRGLRQRDVQRITECLNAQWAQVTGEGYGTPAATCAAGIQCVSENVGYNEQVLPPVTRGRHVEASEGVR
jgi:perosamine synthetase